MNKMIKFRPKIFIAVLCLILVWGCFNKKIYNSQERNTYTYNDKKIYPYDPCVVSIIRATTISKSNLTEEEKFFIRNTNPHWGYYFLAGHFGQFNWKWNLKEGRKIRAYYMGPIDAIDCNEIKVTVSNDETKD